MTYEDDVRTFNSEPFTPYDGLMIPPILVQGAMVQKQVIVGPGVNATEYETCMTCGALIYPDKTMAHQLWHNAIRDTFQSQKTTNQSLSVAVGATGAIVRSIRNLVRPILFAPTPRKMKRRPRPTKGTTMSDIRKNENKAMDQADAPTEDKSLDNPGPRGAEFRESYEKKVMDGLEKK